MRQEDIKTLEPLFGSIFIGPKQVNYLLKVIIFSHDQYLLYHDFVWCVDVDHNGDRIYVGKYHDIDGINKNVFSIHRHLALRQCYASTDCL